LTAALYNTPPVPWAAFFQEVFDVVRCPECAAALDVEEDEVEEGEILSCPECEVELEVTQTQPVLLNAISSEEDEDEEEDEEEEDAEDEEELEEEEEEEG
jgi:alpha-aminoadipate carrier protein LysW